jgi:putative peptide zinc metalloprotease protein
MTYQIAGLMDGERTAQQIWDLAVSRLGDDAPTQDETIRLLGLLHDADVLVCNVSPDTAELLHRQQRKEVHDWWRRFLTPLSIRIGLLDPDAFLERWLPVVRPFFSRMAVVLWGLMIGTALLLAGSHWPELSEGALSLLEPHNLLLIWIVYPLVKGLHELGHAFATKLWGGEVHEMGISFLVFFPIPYVDASAASAFSDKWKRAFVGAAGVGVELVLASLALFVWLSVDAGIAASIAFNVMVIGGASSLFFNGNPLLRFDGYYVLADSIEIPNLSSRSNSYLSYLVLRHCFGLQEVRYPVTACGEGAWFVAYGVASYLYRLTVMVAIALFLANKLFVIGVLLALFAIATQVIAPLLRGVAFVVASPRLARRRTRAVATLAASILVSAGLFAFVPTPSFTNAEGVVWPPEGTHVRAGESGFVLRLLVPRNAVVTRGQALVLMRDPELEAQAAVLEAQLSEVQARFHAERTSDRVRAEISRGEIASLEASLARVRERIGEMVIRSPAQGSFMSPLAGDLAGRFIEQGQLVGYVVGDSIDRAQVVLEQEDVALVRERTESVELRLSSRIAQVVPARISRHVPGASNRLPSPALGTLAGGSVSVDPRDPDGVRTLEKVFQIDLEMTTETGASEIGERVYVRFHHGWETLASRFYRALRRLLLREIGV